jgi:hypothetical protein
MTLVAHELPSLLSYDPTTGYLTWLKRAPDRFASEHAANVWNSRYAGKAALQNINRGGYLKGLIDGRTYLAHRVIWALANGEWPPTGLDIDHVNGIRSDNRLPNLRLATRAENARNRGALRPNHFCGVSARPDGAWRARCKNAEGRYIDRNGFSTERDAAIAYNEMAADFHGDFARLNMVEAA